MGGVGGAVGKIGIGGGIGLAGVSFLLKSIDNKIQQMVEELKKSSPLFKGMKDLQEKTWNLALKPIADIMGLLMRPFLMQALQRMREVQVQAQPIIQQFQAGQITGPEASAKILELTTDALGDLGEIFLRMNQLTAPIEGYVTGYVTTMEKTSEMIARKYGTWADGVADALRDSIIINVKTNVESFEKRAIEVFTNAKTGADDVATAITGFYDKIKSVLSKDAPQSVSAPSQTSFISDRWSKFKEMTSIISPWW